MSLLKFFFTEKCPQCSERIEKAAKFCRRCGAGRADSWRKCTACGVSVAADSQFCWSCNANVAAQPRDQIFSDRWRRTPGVFATRATIETPQDRLRNGIQVDDGTRGALFKDGVLKAELAPGYHAQTSFWERLTGGGKTGGFVEAVIAVSDPISSFVSLGESAALFSKDSAAVEAAVIVKVQLADFGVFSRRMMPTGTDTVRDDDVMLPLTSRVAEVVRRHLSHLSVNDIARSTELRHELEAALGAVLPILLEDYGLCFRGVEDVRLDSAEISRVREAEGGLARAEREQRWERLKREMDLVAKLAEVKDEFALREQIEQWGHESNLTQLERDHIFKMQSAAREHLQRIQALRNKIELERIESEGDREELEGVIVMQDRQRARALRFKKENAELEAELRRKELELQVEIEAKRVSIFKDASAHVIASVVSGDKADQLIRALEALRPLPEITVIQPPGFGAPQPSFMPGGTTASPMEALAKRYRTSVGVVVLGTPDGKVSAMGTAWLAANRGVLVTNAHVAQDMVTASEAGMTSWVIFSGQSSPVRVSKIRIHPGYAESEAKGHLIPSCDVAVLEMETPVMQAGLPLAGRGKLFALRELQSVAYIGFPMEGLVGGGVNLERPSATAKIGSISALEDWHLRHCDDPSQRQLIKHDLGVAGGASGSPLFDESGDVIGIISAGNMERLYDPRTKQFRRFSNPVQLNFAQRIDVLLDWMGW